MPERLLSARPSAAAWTVTETSHAARLLRDCQHEFDPHGLVRKDNPAIVGAIDHAGIE